MKLQKLILYIFLIIGIFSSSHALIVDSVYGDLTDGQICNKIDDLKFPEQGVIDEARKRGLKCDKVNFSLPKNSSVVGEGWACNYRYYKINSECISVPNNSYSPNKNNFLYCNSGYKKSTSGSSCIKTEPDLIPDNAQAVGNSWACDEFFWKVGKKCEAVPEGVYSGPKSNTGKCINGYENNADNNGCDLIIPANSSVVGTSWACDYSYYKVNLECKKVPNNGFSASKTNTWYCKSGYEKNQNRDACISQTPIDTKPTTPTKTKNNNVKTTIIVAVVIGLLIWFISSMDRNPPPRSPQRAQSKPTPIPKPQPTHPSKYKPPLKPQPKPAPKTQPKPAPKAQPKSKTTNINNPSLLLIEIGVAVAFIDGNLSDEEGVILKEWMTKTLKYDNNISSSKQLFNETFSDAIKAAKAGNLIIEEICTLLNRKGTQELNKEAFRFAYEIMGADGEIHKNEVKMIKLLEKNLQISADDATQIRDRFLLKTMIKKDFKIINLLGLGVSASSQTICRELTKEFSKWNGRLNQVKSKKERDNIQKVLDLIGKARKENDC